MPLYEFYTDIRPVSSFRIIPLNYYLKHYRGINANNTLKPILKDDDAHVAKSMEDMEQ